MNPNDDLKEPKGKSEETKVLVQSRERRGRCWRKKKGEGRPKREERKWFFIERRERQRINK